MSILILSNLFGKTTPPARQFPAEGNKGSLRIEKNDHIIIEEKDKR